MKRGLGLLVLMVAYTGDALAQAPIVSPPPSVPVAQPTAAQAQQVSAAQPALPPNRQCDVSSIKGNWKLIDFSENPPGAFSKDFLVMPHQYLHFGDDQYGVMVSLSSPRQLTRKDMLDSFARASDGKMQYVLGKQQGTLYFYHNRVAVESMFCGVVTAKDRQYRVGDILLTPIVSNASTSLLKHYRRPFKKGRPTPMLRSTQSSLTPYSAGAQA